ncbi:MAG: GUN4 domain-containing protein [Oscillatoria princeps RMCB-10]|nr:GUN4 domain-containing protein [Oscillatoria princeps RMCB-10]
MVWPAGHVLQNGKYIIEKKIREGSFGITYLARETAGNLTVIKTLNDEVRQRRDFAKVQQDFLNEALRLAKCSHPHIVRVDELICEESFWCIVMEYIDGTDLATRIETRGALPLSEALLYTRQIGDALTAVHKQGFLHRDIKPLNILLRKDKVEAVLIDFGIAREFTPNLTQIHTLYFSDGFAPIEQYDRRAIRGAYTDVYGLAATLYAMVTAKVPEYAPSRDRSTVKHKTDSLIPPKELNPLLSDRLNEALLLGLALEPENRPLSVVEWLKLLDADSSAPSLIAPPPAPESTPPQPPPETPRWTSAVGMDYSKLRDSLATGNWEDADMETASLMLQVAGREKEGRLDLEDVKKFPCRDLRTIDSLWVEYSKGRFGFSVQKRIWKQVEKNYEEFGDLVGWRRASTWLPYSELSFNAAAPEGHFPTWGRRGRLWSFLAERLVKCSL